MTETLHLRAPDGGSCPDDAVEVVYADSWDELCDLAADLASALQPFAGADCSCFDEDITCEWCRASNALRRYHAE